MVMEVKWGARIVERRTDVSKAIDAVAADNAKTAQRAGYLCGHCAEMLGGRWPRGHRATFHSGECPLCKESKNLASWDDWNWPKAKKVDKVAKAIREV